MRRPGIISKLNSGKPLKSQRADLLKPIDVSEPVGSISKDPAWLSWLAGICMFGALFMAFLYGWSAIPQ